MNPVEIEEALAPLALEPLGWILDRTILDYVYNPAVAALLKR